MSELNQTTQEQAAAARKAEDMPEDVKAALDRIVAALSGLINEIFPSLSETVQAALPDFVAIGKYLKEADE